MNIQDVIDEVEINSILEKTKDLSKEKIFEILKKASLKEGLSLEDVSNLLNVEDPELIDEMFNVSGRIKDEIYGERLVFFAPLYLSSYCVNDCDYCGFHCRNSAPRKQLSLNEVKEQAKILMDMGHKRLLLEFGEHPKMIPIEYVTDVIRTIYGVRHKNGEIRRANVNIAATKVEDYKKLKEVGIGTYQLFQETYHKETYERIHKGPKADYNRQIFAHDRAIEAGLDDVGLGVLFGLYDYKFDVLALLSHSLYLEKKWGVGPHTISVPRLQPAPTVNFNKKYSVSEDELLKIISIIRMAIPYTGMIITTRESQELREKAFKIGVSQTSAASRTDPGGYGKEGILEQFSLQDHRSVDEILKSILEAGLIPSFCTACYRVNRTGATIMKLIKAGEINDLCRPNAILTLKEYLIDYANLDVKSLGEKIIKKYIKLIPSEEMRIKTIERLKRIENGERDLYF